MPSIPLERAFESRHLLWERCICCSNVPKSRIDVLRNRTGFWRILMSCFHALEIEYAGKKHAQTRCWKCFFSSWRKMLTHFFSLKTCPRPNGWRVMFFLFVDSCCCVVLFCYVLFAWLTSNCENVCFGARKILLLVYERRIGFITWRGEDVLPGIELEPNAWQKRQGH